MSREKPRFIAVEGPIGVGKTSLAKRLAETFNYQSLLERGEENPFINRFYRDPRRYALHTQLYFLLQRSQQLSEHRRGDMFEQSLVADYLMDKDNLFAKLNLDSDEMDIYQKVYQHMTINSPVPDMVIYLQAPTGILLDRSKKRGVASERYIERDYLDKLN
ncbi:MAG: deoxynucleoside kinase, partial [Gammaproteobacteria bacterium]|nr:deoxynucleoside kinase [Gammaproteobacteria bacterium]